MMRPLRLAVLMSLCGVSVFARPAPKRVPKVWAVVVGIDAYEDPAIPACKGAESDARAIRSWLVDTAGWDRSQVLLMEPGAPKAPGPIQQQITSLSPSRKNLDWVLKEWLPYRDRVKPGDVVLIAFAGQAIGGKEGDAGSRDLLLPLDARSDRLDDSGWILPDAIDTLASRGENPILLWLDTSLSGRGRPAANLAGRRTSPSRWLGELTRWPGTAAWIAADGKPVALPGPESRRGAFANAVLSAMGTADRPGNLLGALFEAGRDPRLVDQGFRAAGGLGPEWSLWPKVLTPADRVPSEFLLQRGHADRIKAMAFSADGATMVTASMDSTLKVWRVADRVLLRTLPAHMVGATALALSPDGTKLASGDGAGRVLLWSLLDLKPRRFAGPSPHERGIEKLVFSTDGAAFASLDYDGRAVLWKIDGLTPKPLVLDKPASAIAAGKGVVALATLPATAPRAIKLVDLGGRLLREFDGPGGNIVGDAFTIRGEHLGAGNSAGDVGVWTIADGKPVQRFQTGEAVDTIALTDRVLLAGAGRTVWCVWREPGRKPSALEIGGPVASVVSSEDGRSVAASTKAGDILAWTVPEQGDPAPVELKVTRGVPGSTALSFSPQGAGLVSGDADGGVRTWDWPSGEFRSRIEPHGGKIDALAVSRDGRFLVQIDHSMQIDQSHAARIWDLREGRGLVQIPGKWISAAFLPDGESLAMTTADGDAVLVNMANRAVKPIAFLHPKEPNGEVNTWGFGPLAVSPDGTSLLAGSRHGPIACLWPIGGGAPSRIVTEHDDPITAVAFADDSRHWLTASLDGSTKIWGPDGKAPRWVLKLKSGNDPEENPAVIAARFAPRKLSRVVTGHRDGRIVVWDLLDGGQSKPIPLGPFDGEVHAIDFTPDGRRLIAAGADKTVRMWNIAGALRPDAPPAALRMEPQHTEQVNAVVAWPDGKLVASAGDDTMIRFWKPDGSALLGTMAASADGTWVAFDPVGRFDSTPGGEAQVSFLQGDRVLALDQFPDSGRVFGLGGLWLDGKKPPVLGPPLASQPVGLALDPPPPVGKDGEVELTVRLGEAAAENLRLYQNEIPVRDAADFLPTASPSIRKVRVRLGAGENRLVAMASRAGAGSVHGRSNVVTARGPLDANPVKGAIHILALGVSKYQINKLEFADHDANDFATFLADRSVAMGRGKGTTTILQNDQVRPDRVEEELTKIRKKSQPEDTVVVFLAGHTDVLRDRYCLLLDKFPFQQVALAPGQRGPVGVKIPNVPVPNAATVLPYSTIYGVLARMNARNRLVVIDACQAEAIFDDPGVRRVQEKVEEGAHRARTSYLLAARRGSAAGEAPELQHGLMTYLILKGLGADVKRLENPAFGLADLNGDQEITSEELRQYVAGNLPLLASVVLKPGQRGAPAPGDAPNPPAKPDPSRTQGAAIEFPLVKVR